MGFRVAVVHLHVSESEWKGHYLSSGPLEIFLFTLNQLAFKLQNLCKHSLNQCCSALEAAQSSDCSPRTSHRSTPCTMQVSSKSHDLIVKRTLKDARNGPIDSIVRRRIDSGGTRPRPEQIRRSEAWQRCGGVFLCLNDWVNRGFSHALTLRCFICTGTTPESPTSEE